MSRYQTFTIRAGISPVGVQIGNADALVKALADMGFNNVEVHGTPQHLYGYQGDVRPETAEVIIRRQNIGVGSNDIGFKRQEDGRFQAIISEYDRANYSPEWLNRLTQRYDYYAGTATSESVAAGAKTLGATSKAAAGAITAGAEALGALAAMTGRAIQAYQKRLSKEREVAVQREQDIQRKIADIRSRIGSGSSKSKVPVKLPAPVTPITATPVNQERAAARDVQRRVEELKSRLPKVHSEYQALVDQQLLDPQTVQQALQRTEQALNANNLADAQAHLQALDDARIQVMEQLESQWTAQIQYVQERLNALKDCLPQAVSQDLQASINQAHTNWRQLSNADLEALHQKISEFEAQADRIQEAAENLVKAWTEVGYVARILPGTSNGDVMIEVETHEGANTQMRVQFDGQQIELEGPPEERESCARRPQEVMQIFQEQGYQLEWTRLDDQPVTEELLQSYLGTPQEESNEEESIERATESYTPESSQRRLESQGY